jgi:hypothetical protein
MPHSHKSFSQPYLSSLLGLDLGPPCPLCFRLHSLENRWKSPQFRNFGPQPGPEKMSRRTPQPSFTAFFSGGHTRSPVSMVHRSKGESLAIYRARRPQSETLLNPHVNKLVVCNPRKNALLKDGNKSDRIDACKLAELLRGNQLKKPCWS